MAKDLNLNDVELVDDVNEAQTEAQTIPSIGDYEWTEYVLSLLSKDEIDHGNPKVDGLRRIIEKVMGRVILSDSHVLQVPTKDNNYITTVKHRITIECGENDLIEYSAVADAGLHNTDAPYSKFPVAIAETRAEGRALRRALRLKVVTAEELSDVEAPSSVSMTGPERMNNNQLQMITTISRRCDINIGKALTKLMGEGYNIDSISAEDAKVFIKTLNEYQQSTDKIPPEIKGFGDK